MSIHSAAHEPWYKHWYVPGAISLVIGAAIVGIQAYAERSASGSDVPLVACLSLLVSAMVFSLGWMIEKNWTKIPSHVRDDVEAIRDDILGLSKPIREPYLAYLRERILARGRAPMMQLTDAGRRIGTVDECTHELIRQVQRISPGPHREILAVCGQKAWNSAEVRRYYEVNYEKARQGVRVRRIFIAEPGKRFSAGEKRVLREHMSPDNENVEGRVIFPEDLHNLKEYRLPSGFGFAILGEVVIIHWGLDDTRREAGRKLEDPLFVEIHTRIFHRMWSIARGTTPAEQAEIRRRILGERIRVQIADPPPPATPGPGGAPPA